MFATATKEALLLTDPKPHHKEAFTGQAVSNRQFANVRDAWATAGLLNEVEGYPGWFKFGNPGPARGKMTRYKATPQLLAACAGYGITSD